MRRGLHRKEADGAMAQSFAAGFAAARQARAAEKAREQSAARQPGKMRPERGGRPMERSPFMLALLGKRRRVAEEPRVVDVTDEPPLTGPLQAWLDEGERHGHDKDWPT